MGGYSPRSLAYTGAGVITIGGFTIGQVAYAVGGATAILAGTLACRLARRTRRIETH